MQKDDRIRQAFRDRILRLIPSIRSFPHQIRSAETRMIGRSPVPLKQKVRASSGVSTRPNTPVRNPKPASGTGIRGVISTLAVPSSSKVNRSPAGMQEFNH